MTFLTDVNQNDKCLSMYILNRKHLGKCFAQLVQLYSRVVKYHRTIFFFVQHTDCQLSFRIWRRQPLKVPNVSANSARWCAIHEVISSWFALSEPQGGAKWKREVPGADWGCARRERDGQGGGEGSPAGAGGAGGQLRPEAAWGRVQNQGKWEGFRGNFHETGKYIVLEFGRKPLVAFLVWKWCLSKV